MILVATLLTPSASATPSSSLRRYPSGASTAQVAIRQDDGHLESTVTGDGTGFDTATTSYGTELQGMADRLDSIGGSLRVTSAPGAGTSVSGSIPV